ncbi:hypothetical protein ACFE04_023131 [Oxalis oulophora]
MKVTTDKSSQLPPNYHHYYSDLNKPIRRKPQKNPSLTRLKRLGPPKRKLSRERKSRQRTEIVNSKLVNELADAKLTAKRFMQDHDKERKARELIEEVCDELAKEIGEDKAEVEALKQESMKLRDEVEEERKMLQMAEVWREERVQMKLVDAKVALDEKYSQMNFLVGELEKFIKSRNVDLSMEDSRMAELLHKAATNIDIQEVKEFSYEPPNSDDIYAVFEEMNFGDPNEREIEPCSTYSPASKIHAGGVISVGVIVVCVYFLKKVWRFLSIFLSETDDTTLPPFLENCSKLQR